MSFPEPPNDLRRFLAQPGLLWTRAERDELLTWLNVEPQLRFLLHHTALHLGYGSSAEDAEDGWQQFCLTALDGVIESFDPGKRVFPAYLLFCLKRFCWRQGERIREHRRKEPAIVDDPGGERRATPAPVSSAPLPDQVLVLSEDLKRLQQCVEELPATYKDVMVRHHFLEESVAEIAKGLDLSVTNVKQRLFRGRQNLAACLAADRTNAQ